MSVRISTWKALLGGNIRQDVNSSITAATNGGLVVPHYYALANSVNTLTAPHRVSSTKEVDGIFAGATVTWKDMVTLDGTIAGIRARLCQKEAILSTIRLYQPTGSFSKLLLDQPWLSYGKLRANYAAVGGDAQVFQLQNTYTGGTPFQWPDRLLFADDQ